MNKKILAIAIAIIAVIAIIIGLFALIKNDRLNSKSTTNQTQDGTTENTTRTNPVDTSDADQDETDTDPADEDVSNTDQTTTGQDNTGAQTGKILIAYFSRADENYNVGTVEVGNTEIMAGFIKDYLGDKADTFKIDPVTPYPANYKECTEVATQEQRDNARPEFKNANSLKLDEYDTIFIGYPIWWGDVPMIINTFLEAYDFSGKTIIPFNTHEGSGQSGTYNSIKNKMKSSTVNTNGLAITGKKAREQSSRSTVENWLKELGY